VASFVDTNLNGLGRLGGSLLLPCKLHIFQRCSLDSLLERKRNEGLVFLPDDKDVANTGGEVLSGGIFDVNDFKTSRMFLSRGDNTHTTQVATTGNHDEIANLKLDKRLDLAGLKVELHGVVDFDVWMRIADRSTIMEGNVGDSLGSELAPTDLAQLELGFLRADLLKCESSFGIEKQTESSIVDFFDVDDIHESSGECAIGPHFIIHLDQSLF